MLPLTARYLSSRNAGLRPPVVCRIERASQDRAALDRQGCTL